MSQGCQLSQVPGQQLEQRSSNANSRKVLGEHWSPFPLSPENKARDASRGVQGQSAPSPHQRTADFDLQTDPASNAGVHCLGHLRGDTP